MDDIDLALQDAMGSVDRPAMPELTSGVLARGRRVRRRRWIGAGLGVTGSTAAVVTAALLVAGSSGAGPARTTPVYVGGSGVSVSGSAAGDPTPTCPAGQVYVQRPPVVTAPSEQPPSGSLSGCGTATEPTPPAGVPSVSVYTPPTGIDVTQPAEAGPTETPVSGGPVTEPAEGGPTETPVSGGPGTASPEGDSAVPSDATASSPAGNG